MTFQSAWHSFRLKNLCEVFSNIDLFVWVKKILRSSSECQKGLTWCEGKFWGNYFRWTNPFVHPMHKPLAVGLNNLMDIDSVNTALHMT